MSKAAGLHGRRSQCLWSIRMLSVADRYVFTEWLKAFVLVLGSMFGLLLLFEIQDSFTDLIGYEATSGQILKYYLVIAPSFLTITLPATVLVSILYALGQLHRSNEFIALRAAGMSVYRVTRSIWLASLLISAGLWYLNSSLIPWSVEQSDQLIKTIRLDSEAKTLSTDEVGIVEGLAFDNRNENRMWFINRYSEYKKEAYGISVSIMDEERREVRRVMARYGWYNEEEGYWSLFDGRERLNDLDTGRELWPPFERLEAKDLTDDPSLMLLFGKRPKDLSFLQLKRITDNFRKEDNPSVLAYEARLHALMASAASCLIVAGIAIPFAVSGVRTNPAVGVSKSIGLFFVFYILTSVLNALGREGSLSPEFAAWSPMAIMIVLAYVLMRRVK
ncbi:LptF/LptG family permease [Pelagicoccus sp. NFK12]|uniref:LptF/LptG family permease n=1 Tax=Pelagicoccus enzymogenes TaxID=2773457 RepID=A0A927F680_9BACT|nr:LptF/LptG family permease [Pelagicoccus enzymogenes]MBD5777981.1 LptF/LptG family permease [Pelagicoccus enzymogenes]MDQ8197961.1 LptF/LptG family permease [Pelagicoccus enzymogenes]